MPGDPSKPSDDKLPDAEDSDVQIFNASSTYTIVIEKDLIGAKIPTIKINDDGHLELSVGPLDTRKHAVDERVPRDTSSPVKRTKLTLKLKQLPY